MPSKILLRSFSGISFICINGSPIPAKSQFKLTCNSVTNFIRNSIEGFEVAFSTLLIACLVRPICSPRADWVRSVSYTHLTLPTIA